MKALLAFGMSIVTATAIVGFTACGDEHDHVDENKDGKCDICETDMTPGGEQDGTGLNVDVQKVELNKSELTLEIGGVETLTATVTPDNATNKVVSWTSSDPSVATVSGGKVTAVAAGTATITATADGKSATCTVTVNESSHGDLPEITEWTEVGNPIHGEVTEDGSDYIWHHILFVGEAANGYEFDSYEATVKVDGAAGVINQDGSKEFTADNVSAHTYDMNIRIQANRYQSVEFTINFKKDGETVAIGKYSRAGDKEIVLDSVSLSVSKGKTETVNIISINGSSDVTGKKISWTIADTEGTGVATIPENSDGASVVVTAVAEGKATLTCTVGEGADAFGKTCVITVVEGEVVITAADVSGQATFSNKFQSAGEAVQIYFNLQSADFADLVQQIDPAKTTVSVTMDGNESTGNILRKEWQAPGAYNLWLQVVVESDWSHDYVFRFSFKNAKGDEVAYGTYTEAAPSALTLDKSTLNLTLSEGTTVSETLTATVVKVEGSVQWSIDDNTVATITDNNDGTVTVTAVAKGTATITATVGGLTETCEVNVLEEGEEAPVTTITDFNMFNGPYGDGKFYQFRLQSTDDNASKYASIVSSYAYAKVNGIQTDHKELLTEGANCLLIVHFPVVAESGETYKIDLCDANGNILATLSWIPA